METFLDRLKAEREELFGRLERLWAFIGHGMPGVTDQRQKELLEMQCAYMGGYLRVLDERLSRLDGKAEVR